MRFTDEHMTIHMGRTEIRTSTATITKDNVIAEVARAFTAHSSNRTEIEFLIDYFRGKQPKIIERTKLVRDDVDNRVIVNYAKATTRDIVGYLLGKPINYVARKTENTEPLKTFVDWLDYEGKGRGDFELAEFASICGTSYRGIFPDPEDDGTPPFAVVTLDPRDTFCVYATDVTRSIPVFAVHYYPEYSDSIAQVPKAWNFTVYTDKKKYTFTCEGVTPAFGDGVTVSEKAHIVGRVPIVEYRNNYWRMGDWEAAISILDAINLVTSDSVNDVEQFVNSILSVIGAELTPDTLALIKTEKVINLHSIPPGVQVDVKYIAQALDAASVSVLREYLESSLRVVLGVPDRKTRSGGGGDTGDAVFMRDGWMDIDLVAANKELFFTDAERRMIEVALAICSKKASTELKGLEALGIEIKFLRSKTANLQVKSQAYAAFVNTSTMDPADALSICDLVTNPKDIIARGEEYRLAHTKPVSSTPTGTTDGAPVGDLNNGGVQGVPA